jgi:hypothetical protein
MRRFLPLLVACLVVSGHPTPADAWANGRRGPDTFGTHDWVLARGIRMAGTRASWVCRDVALRSTDDPDTVDGIDHASATWWHVYDVWGSQWGDAPAATRVWFVRAQRALDRGKPCAASRAVGIMSHFVADVAQPMHTDGSLDAEDRVHGPYESAVDARCASLSSCRYHATYDGRDRTRPERRTVRIAVAAHRWYGPLVKAYARAGYTSKVDAITRRQLNRAANAVADLITSLRP